MNKVQLEIGKESLAAIATLLEKAQTDMVVKIEAFAMRMAEKCDENQTPTQRLEGKKAGIADEIADCRERLAAKEAKLAARPDDAYAPDAIVDLKLELAKLERKAAGLTLHGHSYSRY